MKDKQVIKSEEVGSLEEALGPDDPLFRSETKTTLINLKTYRGPPRPRALIDRRTTFGNHQYKIGVYNFYLKRNLTREDCVSLFRTQFEHRMQTDRAWRKKVETLRGKQLACWCTPLACHGDVYVEYFEKGSWW